ncbi:MAG TPA: OAM dimerization domain-containing protein [Bacillota bacterium]|jgi:beta-lysine 5,6-aminomutase beta subunit
MTAILSKTRSDRTEVAKVDLTDLRPYGDAMNDGAVQVSFTLPLEAGEVAVEAAKAIARRMSLEEPQVVHSENLTNGFTFFIVYGKLPLGIDAKRIDVPKVQVETMDFDQINSFIRDKIGRKVIVVGASTGTDAHTLGLDAIMNMKGYAGSYGLERYPEIAAVNMGSQVPNETLVAKAIELGADAILVSQTVTQKNIHVKNLTELVELLEAEDLRDRVILVCGGPRITHELAVELGYDAGFGPGTLPPMVASYLAQEIVKRGLARKE